MKKIITVLFIILISSCNYYKQKFTFAFEVESESEPHSKLYIEVYTAGLLGSLRSHYLTDSTTFRTYIGTFDDEHEGYIYSKKSDTIYIKKVFSDYSASKKIISHTDFTLSHLKRLHNLQD